MCMTIFCKKGYRDFLIRIRQINSQPLFYTNPISYKMAFSTVPVILKLSRAISLHFQSRFYPHFL